MIMIMMSIMIIMIMMTESEIKSSIVNSTMEANDTFNAYYDGDTPTIDFKIQNDTDYL